MQRLGAKERMGLEGRGLGLGAWGWGCVWLEAGAGG